MGGAVIERDTTLLPLSMVLKEMTMLTGVYEGSPAEPASGSALPPPVVVLRPRGAHAEFPEEVPTGKELVYVTHGSR
jgi:hypothetical protein